jgi:hypothetical protein
VRGTGPGPSLSYRRAPGSALLSYRDFVARGFAAGGSADYEATRAAGPSSAAAMCRAICAPRSELIVPSAWAQQAASLTRASTERRLVSAAPIPASASSALETAVRSWRTSRSISSSSRYICEPPFGCLKAA